MNKPSSEGVLSIGSGYLFMGRLVYDDLYYRKSFIIGNHYIECTMSGCALIRLSIMLLSACATVLPESLLAQKKYFEYNNPHAIRINQKVLAKLSKHEWHGDFLHVKVREDTFTYKSSWAIRYDEDGTFEYGGNKGTWKIEYNRYLKHVTEEPLKWSSSISGIYSILEISDSVLILQKLQTSSRDMSRTLYFRKDKSTRYASSIKPPANPITYRIDYPFSRREIRKETLDSLRRVAREPFSTYGFSPNGDTLYIPLEDSILKIHVKPKTD